MKLFEFSEHTKHRRQLPFLLCERGLLGTACEVGVHTGDYALDILSRWPGKRFIAIDNYAPHPDVPGDRGEHKFVAIGRLVRHLSRVDWVGVDASKALASLTDSSLDFCYIDAGHDFPEVSQQIAAAWPRIAPGGILAGHDFDWTCPGVVEAVRDFCEQQNLVAQLTQDHDGPWSWFVTKGT